MLEVLAQKMFKNAKFLDYNPKNIDNLNKIGYTGCIIEKERAHGFRKNRISKQADCV